MCVVGSFLLGSCGLVGSGGEKRSKKDSIYFHTVLNSGDTWTSEPKAGFAEVAGFARWLTISGDTVNSKNYYTESLSLVVPFRGEGKYPLIEIEHQAWGGTRSSGASFYESDGDALVASYSPTSDSTLNWIIIKDYDSTTGVLEGTFRTTLVVDSSERVSEPGEPPRRRPDTLRFTDGEFRVKVEDRRDQ